MPSALQMIIDLYAPKAIWKAKHPLALQTNDEKDFFIVLVDKPEIAGPENVQIKKMSFDDYVLITKSDFLNDTIFASLELVQFTEDFQWHKFDNMTNEIVSDIRQTEIDTFKSKYTKQVIKLAHSAEESLDPKDFLIADFYYEYIKNAFKQFDVSDEKADTNKKLLTKNKIGDEQIKRLNYIYESFGATNQIFGFLDEINMAKQNTDEAQNVQKLIKLINKL